MEISKIISLAERVQRDLKRIRTKVSGSVMFVDLVGSTEYKATHPAEEDWLPRLATFLLSVTNIVQEHGRVVKYIGDEVMAFFEGPAPALHAAQAAERVLQFCKEFKQVSFRAKIALDYGSVSMLDFSAIRGSKKGAKIGRRDPNGLTVDRCARIMSKAVPDTILCSETFRAASNDKRRWRYVGAFRPKGIPNRVKVYQLTSDRAPQVEVRDEKMTLPECIKRLTVVEHQLDETKALRRPVARRPR